MLSGLMAGCDSGPERFPVSGRVVIDGEPLTSGTVMVAPSDDRPAYGKIDTQGRFTLTTHEDGDGCVAGTHPVTVTATEMISKDKMRHLVPESYTNFSTSDLTVTIEGPKDDWLIELSWEGEQPDVTTFEGDVDPSAM
jgi:hypothetical protein